MKLHKVIARHACETWPTTLEDKRKVAIVERKFPRKICGPKIYNVTQKYEIQSDEEVYNAFGEPRNQKNLVQVLIIEYVRRRTLQYSR